jgi:hypothetical protein
MGMVSCVGMGVSVGTDVDVIHEASKRTIRENSLLIMELYSLNQQGHSHRDHALVDTILI